MRLTLLLLILSGFHTLSQTPDLARISGSDGYSYYYQHTFKNNFLSIPLQSEDIKRKGHITIQVNPGSRTKFGEWSEQFSFESDSIDQDERYLKVELEKIDSTLHHFNILVSYFNRKKEQISSIKYHYNLVSYILRPEFIGNNDTLTINRSSVNVAIETRFLFGQGCLDEDSKVKIYLNGEFWKERTFSKTRPFETVISRIPGLHKLEFEEFGKTYFIIVK